MYIYTKSKIKRERLYTYTVYIYTVYINIEKWPVQSILPLYLLTCYSISIKKLPIKCSCVDQAKDQGTRGTVAAPRASRCGSSRPRAGRQVCGRVRRYAPKIPPAGTADQQLQTHRNGAHRRRK